MKNIADRIKELQEFQNFSNNEFAEQLQISPAALSHIYSGRNNPSLTILEAIALRFPNVNINYLLKGTGQLFEQSVDVNTSIKQSNKFLSSENNSEHPSEKQIGPQSEINDSKPLRKDLFTHSNEKEDFQEFTNVNIKSVQIVKVALFTSDGKVFFYTPTEDNPLL